nr:hypothetical protein [Candidatus Gracilibacteria bacterium]
MPDTTDILTQPFAPQASRPFQDTAIGGVGCVYPLSDIFLGEESEDKKKNFNSLVFYRIVFS